MYQLQEQRDHYDGGVALSAQFVFANYTGQGARTTRDSPIRPESALTLEEVRTAIREMRRKRLVWFLISLGICGAATGVFFTSSGLIAVVAYGVALLFGLLAPIFGLSLLRLRSEARSALCDYPRFKGDPECFRRLHRRIYKFPW